MNGSSEEKAPDRRPVDKLVELLLLMHWTMHNRRDLDGYAECHRILHEIFDLAPRRHLGKLKALLKERQ